MKRDDWAALTLAALLAAAGVAHLVIPDGFDAIIPHQLPGPPRAWTSVSGIMELGLAVGLAGPRTRRTAATLSAVFFVAVFPANIQMAIDWSSRSAPELAVALARLPLQLALIWWALAVRRGTPTQAGEAQAGEARAGERQAGVPG